MHQPILLVGPSVRAMAYSALRAGFTPICFDLFADLDLQAVAKVERIPLDHYPNKLPELLQSYDRQIPLMYTGGLENYPELLQELSKQRPVWGYVPQGEGVRSPAFLDALASKKTFERLQHPDTVPAHGSWLLKPISGAGGRGIRHWQPAEVLPESHFLEEFLEDADAISVLFLADGQETRCLGMTRQLVGTRRLHAPSPFTYTGSIGPFSPPVHMHNTIAQIGNSIVEADPQIRGIFGIDLAFADQNRFYLFEVNPRYTASTEVLELQSGMDFISQHAAAFCLVEKSTRLSPLKSSLGKAIYFAPFDLYVPELPWLAPYSGQVPILADVPAPGTFIRQGEPVCTLFDASSYHWDVVEAHLEMQALWFDELFERYKA